MLSKKHSKNLWRSTEKLESPSRTCVEVQEKNMAQLAKIGAVIEQRWGSKEESEIEEDGDDDKGFKDGSGESQKERTLLSAFC